MSTNDEEMIYYANKVKSLCKTRYKCSECPMRYVNPLKSEDTKCILMSGIRPELWILPGDYANAINRIIEGGSE